MWWSGYNRGSSIVARYSAQRAFVDLSRSGGSNKLSKPAANTLNTAVVCCGSSGFRVCLWWGYKVCFVHSIISMFEESCPPGAHLFSRAKLGFVSLAYSGVNNKFKQYQQQEPGKLGCAICKPLAFFEFDFGGHKYFVYSLIGILPFFGRFCTHLPELARDTARYPCQSPMCNDTNKKISTPAAAGWYIVAEGTWRLNLEIERFYLEVQERNENGG